MFVVPAPMLVLVAAAFVHRILVGGRLCYDVLVLLRRQAGQFANESTHRGVLAAPFKVSCSSFISGI
jgi:hypothetical protein